MIVGNRRWRGSDHGGRWRELAEEREAARPARLRVVRACTCSACTRRRSTRTWPTRCSTTARTATSSPTSTRAPTKARRGPRLPEICRPNGLGSLRLPRTTSTPTCCSAGTEFGLFFTVDGGEKWIRLRNNLPTIPVRDLAIQERENDLVLATFGRGFYVLDDYSPLRSVTAEVLQKDGHIFPAKAAVIEIADTSKTRGSQGEQSGSPKTRRRRRGDHVLDTKTRRERSGSSGKRPLRAAEQKKTAPPYPTQAELTAEADEEAPQTFLTITDARGRSCVASSCLGGEAFTASCGTCVGFPRRFPQSGAAVVAGRRWLWRRSRPGQLRCAGHVSRVSLQA